MTSPIELFDLSETRGYLVVTFREPSLSARDDLEQFFERIHRHVGATDRPKLIMDFRRVENLSSVFVGFLLALNRKINEKGGSLELIQVNAFVYQVFTLTRVHEYLKVRKAEEGYDPPAAEIATTLHTHQGAWWLFCLMVSVSAMVGVVLLIRLGASTDDSAKMLPANDLSAWAGSYFLAAIPGAIAVFLTQRWLRYTHIYVQWTLAAITFGLTLWASMVMIG